MPKMRLQVTEKKRNKNNIRGHLLQIISIVQTLMFVKEYLNQCQQVKRTLFFLKSIVVVLEESAKISSKHLLLLTMELQSWEVFIIAIVLKTSITIGVEVEALVQNAAVHRWLQNERKNTLQDSTVKPHRSMSKENLTKWTRFMLHTMHETMEAFLLQEGCSVLLDKTSCMG